MKFCKSFLAARATLFVSMIGGLLLGACVAESGRMERTSEPQNEPAPPPLVVGSLPPPTATQPPLVNYPKTIQDSGIGSAALYLYAQAQSARAAGRAEHAVALLQRALHLEPRNAFLWQALADAQLTLQQPDQAESAAQKSSSLARGNPYLDAGNWRLIASARQAQGDADGARTAQAQADQIARALASTP